MGDQCPPDFVRVASDGSKFEVNGAPFYFSGANCYYMMVRHTLPCPNVELPAILQSGHVEWTTKVKQQENYVLRSCKRQYTCTA